jgi:hypothetical protein
VTPEPWFIATKTFTPRKGETWTKYVDWSGLTQLNEVVSLDDLLCPTVLPEIRDEYWPHIVDEDFMITFFTDLEFLLEQLPGIGDHNLLCVYRNPPLPPEPPAESVAFDLLGYDLVDVQGGVSALTNCGGFPDVFDNAELSPKGLLTSHARAVHVQAELRAKHAGEDHTNCHVWAVFRAAQ